MRPRGELPILKAKGAKPWRYDYTIHRRVRVRFIVGMSPPDDLDFLSQAELKGVELSPLSYKFFVC
jgi:hypothetical protein